MRTDTAPMADDDAAARRRDAIRALVDTAPPASTEQTDVIAGILRHATGSPTTWPAVTTDASNASDRPR